MAFGKEKIGADILALRFAARTKNARNLREQPFMKLVRGAIAARLVYLRRKSKTGEQVPSLHSLPAILLPYFPEVYRVTQEADSADCLPASIACAARSTLEIADAAFPDSLDHFFSDRKMFLGDIVQEPTLGQRYFVLVVGGHEDIPTHCTVLDCDGTFRDPHPVLPDHIPFETYPFAFVTFIEVNYYAA